MKSRSILIPIALILIISFLSVCSKSPTKPSELEVVYSEQVVKLEDNAIQSIVSMDTSGTIIFSQKTSNLEKLKPGDIIFCQPTTVVPYGFLKRVQSVNFSGNNVIVTTSNATLEDVFQTASFSYQKTLTMDDLQGTPLLKKGVSVKRSQGDGFYVSIEDIKLYDLDGDPMTEEDQIKADGSIEINPSFQFNLEIDNFKLQEVRFVSTTTETAELEITCGISISYEPEYRLAEFKFSPITIWVGWVPIVIYPILGIDVGADVSATVGFKTGVTQTATLEAGLEFKNNSWNQISNFSKSFDFIPPELTNSVSVKGYTGPQLNLLLYGIAGPYAELNGYLELSADIFQTPWWELYGGAEVGVGVEVQFLGREIVDYYVPGVIGYKQLIAEAQDILEGTIRGVVKDAVTLNPLENVAIKVTRDGSTVTNTSSNSSGEYVLTVPVGTNYVVEFSRAGYISVRYENIQVGGNTYLYLETILQINQNYSGTGNIEGTIYNALSGAPVSGLTLSLRSGINNKTGTVLRTATTDSYGNYSYYNVEAGNYTVEASAAGYTTTYFSVISIGGRTTGNQDATITPELNPDEYRIVLTWGQYPQDLDSHLTGPTPDGYRFHTYFSDMTYSYQSEIYAALDIDDITSYGPETTTIYKQINGLYRYSVHDYTNRNASYSYALSNSNAQVRVYKGSELVQTFYVPTNMQGTLWTVFELFNDTVVPKNIMSYESEPGSIRKAGIPETDAHLLRNLPVKR